MFVVGTGLVKLSLPQKVELEGKKGKAAGQEGAGRGEEFGVTRLGRKDGMLPVFQGGSLAGGLAEPAESMEPGCSGVVEAGN